MGSRPTQASQAIIGSTFLFQRQFVGATDKRDETANPVNLSIKPSGTHARGIQGGHTVRFRIFKWAWLEQRFFRNTFNMNLKNMHIITFGSNF